MIEKIKIKIWVAVFVACFGIHLLTPNGLIDLGIGDQLTFGCALSFAIHIIFQGRYMKKIKSINNFFFIQSMVVAILSLFSGFLFEDFSAIQFDFSLLMAFNNGYFSYNSCFINDDLGTNSFISTSNSDYYYFRACFCGIVFCRLCI